MSRHRKVRRNPAMTEALENGRVFARVPVGTRLTTDVKSDLIAQTTGATPSLYWIGDGKYLGFDKKLILAAWPIDKEFAKENLFARVQDTDEGELVRILRSSNYPNNALRAGSMVVPSDEKFHVYQLVYTGNPSDKPQLYASAVGIGIPFHLDKLGNSATDKDTKANASPPYPMRPEGVKGSAATTSYGRGGYSGSDRPGWMGYEKGQTQFEGYPSAFYPSLGYRASQSMSPRTVMEYIMMDTWGKASNANITGPLSYPDQDPRKNVLVSDYVGFSLPRNMAPTAELQHSRRPHVIDEIPGEAFPMLLPQLVQNLLEDAKTDSEVKQALVSASRWDAMKMPYSIQWRVLEFVHSGDIRFYVCQWKFMGEGHPYEIDGEILYQTPGF